jgi:hypothetical protein
MKKNLLTLLLVLIANIVAFGQSDSFEVSKVSVQSGTQSQLYLKARTWIAKSFNSAKDVIQMDDKSLGRIIVKGTMKARNTQKDKPAFICEDGYLNFTLTIDVKANKSRMAFDDFEHKGMNVACDLGKDPSYHIGKFDGSKNKDADFISIKENARIDCNNLILDFEKYLKSKPKEDNW